MLGLYEFCVGLVRLHNMYLHLPSFTGSQADVWHAIFTQVIC